MSSPAPLLPARARQRQGDATRVIPQRSGEVTNADPAEAVAQADIDSDVPGERVNPLVAVVTGMAIMFGTLALLLALG